MTQSTFPLCSGEVPDWRSFALCLGKVPVAQSAFPLYLGEVRAAQSVFALCSGEVPVAQSAFALCLGKVPVAQPAFALCSGKVRAAQSTFVLCFGEVCPQGGIRSLKSGGWRPPPSRTQISAKLGPRGSGEKNALDGFFADVRKKQLVQNSSQVGQSICSPAYAEICGSRKYD